MTSSAASPPKPSHQRSYTPDIIFHVARGWESKSVEEQQAEAASTARKIRPLLTPEQLSKERKRQSLMLARRRVLQQLELARNPQHREMLQRALADLDAELSQLG